MDAPQNDNGGKETQLLPNWAASLMNSSYFDYGSEANGDCPTEADGHATPSSLSESEDDDMSDFSSLRTIDSVSSNDIPNGGDCCVVNIDTPAFNPGQHEQEREKEEELRLSALKSYEILNSLNHCNVQTSLDRITSLTSRILRVPIACITLVDSDQIYFISKKGLNSRVSSMESWKCIQQIPRLNGFCSYTIQCKDDFFVVPDAMTDQRFAHRSTLTLDFPQARFYAGTPLKCPETGCNLGTYIVRNGFESSWLRAEA